MTSTGSIFNPNDGHRELKWMYPAALANVEQVCSAADQVLDEYSLQRGDRFAVELLLRESLNNAVVHGCNLDSHLFFSCRMMISNREITIEVSDDGTGFDWHSKPEIPPDHLGESGRGLTIYAIYAHSISYNETGNCVTLTRTFNYQGDKND